jgi:hypothetical protein
MTMLQLFRLWARRAPLGERIAASIGAALALALIGWLVVPSSNATTDAAAALESQGSTLAGTGPSAQGSDGAPAGAAGLGGTTAAGSVPGATGAAGATGATASGCKAPAGATDQGVTASTIKVAVIVLSIAGPVGNSTYGVPAPAVQQANFQKVVDSINGKGGVACRKVVAQYFQANPVDQSSLQQLCLSIVQAKPFLLFEGAGYGYVFPAGLDCFAQAHIPWISPTFSTATSIARWFPYGFFAMQSDAEYHTMIFALAKRGWFSAANGFKKLGVVYQDCDTHLVDESLSWIKQVGVTSTNTFDLGCNGLFSPPSVISQSILQFQQAGVTHVTFINDERDFANYTKIAQQQHFNPKYGFSDETQVAVTYSNNGPDLDNIDGATVVDNTAVGEEHTPGMAPTASTMKCLAIFGMKLSYPVANWSDAQTASSYGGYCSQLWEFKAMVEHAPALQRNALAAGLQAARSIDTAYAIGPVNWSAPRTTWGGQFWRVNQFFKNGCGCWRLVDKTWHAPL